MNPARFYGSLCVRRQFKVSLEIQLLEDLPVPLSQLPVQLPGALSAAENLEQVPLGRMWAHRVGISALALALLRLLFKKSWNPSLVWVGRTSKLIPFQGHFPLSQDTPSSLEHFLRYSQILLTAVLEILPFEWEDWDFQSCF